MKGGTGWQDRAALPTDKSDNREVPYSVGSGLLRADLLGYVAKRKQRGVFEQEEMQDATLDAQVFLLRETSILHGKLAFLCQPGGR